MSGLGLRKSLRASFGSGSSLSRDDNLNGEIFTFCIFFLVLQGAAWECEIYFESICLAPKIVIYCTIDNSVWPNKRVFQPGLLFSFLYTM